MSCWTLSLGRSSVVRVALLTVEGELGVLAGVEDDVVAEHHTYTQPSEVVDFVSRTGVDSLAISIGTSHGANKFTPAQCTRDANGILIPPPLRFDILEEIEKRKSDSIEDISFAEKIRRF